MVPVNPRLDHMSDEQNQEGTGPDLRGEVPLLLLIGGPMVVPDCNARAWGLGFIKLERGYFLRPGGWPAVLWPESSHTATLWAELKAPYLAARACVTSRCSASFQRVPRGHDHLLCPPGHAQLWGCC